MSSIIQKIIPTTGKTINGVSDVDQPMLCILSDVAKKKYIIKNIRPMMAIIRADSLECGSCRIDTRKKVRTKTQKFETKYFERFNCILPIIIIN